MAEERQKEHTLNGSISVLVVFAAAICCFYYVCGTLIPN